MHIISIVSPKGGTGKTSVAIALASFCALRGRTLLYDLDPQATAARWYHNHRAPALRARGLPMDGLELRRPPLDRFPARLLADAESAEPPLWAVVDTAGGAYRALEAAAGVSDFLVTPLQPSMPDIAALPRMLSYAASLPSPPPMAALLTRVPPRAAARTALAREALSAAGIRCFSAEIAQTVLWQDAYEAGLAPQETPHPRAPRVMEEIGLLSEEIASAMTAVRAAA